MWEPTPYDDPFDPGDGGPPEPLWALHVPGEGAAEPPSAPAADAVPTATPEPATLELAPAQAPPVFPERMRVEIQPPRTVLRRLSEVVAPIRVAPAMQSAGLPPDVDRMEQTLDRLQQQLATPRSQEPAAPALPNLMDRIRTARVKASESVASALSGQDLAAAGSSAEIPAEMDASALTLRASAPEVDSTTAPPPVPATSESTPVSDEPAGLGLAEGLVVSQSSVLPDLDTAPLEPENSELPELFPLAPITPDLEPAALALALSGSELDAAAPATLQSTDAVVATLESTDAAFATLQQPSVVALSPDLGLPLGSLQDELILASTDAGAMRPDDDLDLPVPIFAEMLLDPTPDFPAALAGQVFEGVDEFDFAPPEPLVLLAASRETALIASAIKPVSEPDSPAWLPAPVAPVVPPASLAVQVAPVVPAAPVAATSNSHSASRHLESLVAAIDSEMTQAAPAAPQRSEKRAEAQRYVVFHLGASRYALPIGEVIEMATVPRTTPLPNVPGFVRGVANLRGEVLAVIDLRSLLQVEPATDSFRERLIVVRAPQGDAAVGLIVDSVRGLARLGAAALQQTSLPLEDRVADFLQGIASHEDQALNVLDTQKLFSAPEVTALSAH